MMLFLARRQQQQQTLERPRVASATTELLLVLFYCSAHQMHLTCTAPNSDQIFQWCDIVYPLFAKRTKTLPKESKSQPKESSTVKQSSAVNTTAPEPTYGSVFTGVGSNTPTISHYCMFCTQRTTKRHLLPR